MRGIRGKKVRAVKEGTLIATVDIGMTTNTGYCTTIDGRDIKPFRFENTREGFDTFWHMIVASKNTYGCTEVMVGYESTGPYAEPLAQYLMDKPVTLVQVNPLHTKRLKEVHDNSPRKTDDKDPRVIGDVLRLGHALSVVVPEGDAAYLRRLNNARERHVGERTALLNQIQQLVFLIFPEFKTVFKDGHSPQRGTERTSFSGWPNGARRVRSPSMHGLSWIPTSMWFCAQDGTLSLPACGRFSPATRSISTGDTGGTATSSRTGSNQSCASKIHIFWNLHDTSTSIP
jgi:hypothetical protein